VQVFQREKRHSPVRPLDHPGLSGAAQNGPKRRRRQVGDVGPA
jgi:hypothetical protein